MHGQRVRLANLRLQLLQVQRRRDYLMAAFLFEEQRQHQQQRRRTMWVKSWLLRRVTLGHYDTLMQELMRESRGDFKSYLRNMQQFFHLSHFRQAECTTAVLEVSFFVLLCPLNQSAVHLPRALADFCSFSDTIYSALSAYFDIMMLQL